MKKGYKMSHITLEELLASDIYADEDPRSKVKKVKIILDDLLFPTMEVCAVLQIKRPSLYAKGLTSECMKRRGYVERKGFSVGYGDVGINERGVLASISPKTLGRLDTLVKIHKDDGIEVGNDEEWRMQVDVLTTLYREGFITEDPMRTWMKIVGKELIKKDSNERWNLAYPIWRPSAITRQNEIYENVFLILNIILERLKVKVEFDSLRMKIEFISLI